MISKLCYELYKVDWKHSHMITTEREMDSIKNYYKDLVDDETEYTYSDYLGEFGYDGDLYVCYEEFLDNEYLEEDYICNLLNNEKLVAMYYKDIDLRKEDTMTEITLTREEKRKLKEWLYSELNTLSEYHYDLYPSKRDSFDRLIKQYFYWGDEYNDGYISVERYANEDKLFAYLVQEFKKFMAIPVSIRY